MVLELQPEFLSRKPKIHNSKGEKAVWYHMSESSVPKDINFKRSPDMEVDNEWKAKYKFFTRAVCTSIKRIEEVNRYYVF